MNSTNNIRTKKFIIVLHEYSPTGPGHDLRDYLLMNYAKEIVFITHPLLNLKQNYVSRSCIKVYAGDVVAEKTTKFNLVLPMPFLYLKDLVLTILWIIEKKKKYDLYIGLDPLNAFAGIVLKKLHLVDKVVYYTIDYIPKRYKSFMLNFFYHKLDKFCVYHADDTWNVGKAVKQAREKYNHMDQKIYFKQYNLPIGVWLNKMKPIFFEKVNKYKLVYIGSIKHIMGIDLIVEAMPELSIEFPQIRLDIIGGGIDEEKLKYRVKQLKIEKYITFHGWIKEKEKIQSIASDAAIGIATFNTDESSIEVKNADPSKVKEYLSMGLPVITTNVLPNYKDLEKNNCAVVIPYSIEALIKAIEMLLTNKKLLQIYKENAFQYVARFDYPILFAKALDRVL